MDNKLLVKSNIVLVYVVANVYWRQKYTFASNFEANVYFCLKLQTWRVKYTLAPNFEANVYFSLKLQTWRIKYTLSPNLEAKVLSSYKLLIRVEFLCNWNVLFENSINIFISIARIEEGFSFRLQGTKTPFYLIFSIHLIFSNFPINFLLTLLFKPI